MRVGLGMMLLLFSGCAGQKLALAPPFGIDFSGAWKLNEADSDDPQRLLLSQLAGPVSGATAASGGQSAGRGGRAGAAPMAAIAAGPAMPPLGDLADGLRWPGKLLDIKQVVGVVAMTSGGVAQVCQPAADALRNGHRQAANGGGPGGRNGGRDRGDGPPPTCGWDGMTLVMRSGDSEDRAPFEQRFSVSADGQRLVEVVGFKGGRSNGFTLSRVWDRVAPPTGDTSSQPQARQ